MFPTSTSIRDLHNNLIPSPLQLLDLDLCAFIQLSDIIRESQGVFGIVAQVWKAFGFFLKKGWFEDFEVRAMDDCGGSRRALSRHVVQFEMYLWWGISRKNRGGCSALKRLIKIYLPRDRSSELFPPIPGKVGESVDNRGVMWPSSLSSSWKPSILWVSL